MTMIHTTWFSLCIIKCWIGSWISYSHRISYSLVWRCPEHVGLWLNWSESPLSCGHYHSMDKFSAKTESGAWVALYKESHIKEHNRSARHTQSPAHVGGDNGLTPTTSYTTCRAQCKMKMWSSLFNIWISKQWEPSTILSVGLCAPVQPHPLLLTPGLGHFAQN